MRADDIPDILKVLAVAIGIISGAYALYQNYRKDKATSKQERAAQRLEDKAAGFKALEDSLKSQQIVITGLTKGLEDCLRRDNEKGAQIETLERRNTECRIEIMTLERRIRHLEGHGG